MTFISPKFSLKNEYTYHPLPIPMGLNYWGLWTSLLYVRFPNSPNCKLHTSEHYILANNYWSSWQLIISTIILINTYDGNRSWKSNLPNITWLVKKKKKNSNPSALTPQPLFTSLYCPPTYKHIHRQREKYYTGRNYNIDIENPVDARHQVLEMKIWKKKEKAWAWAERDLKKKKKSHAG